MEYQEFVSVIREKVQIAAGKEANVSVSHILKNNIPSVDGLTILRKGENISPAIWLRPFFGQYQYGISIDKIAEEILEYHARAERPAACDVSFYTDYEQVKKQIACKLVHAGMNEAMLREVPHRYFLDLAVVYYYKMEHPSFGNASILIKNDHLMIWNITPEELDRDAMQNMPDLLPFEFVSLADLIDELTGRSAEYLFQQSVPMYVLTNCEKYFGAAVLLQESVRKEIGQRLRSDYYILPSSIHECIVMPILDELDPQLLHEMVREINQEHVAEEEILSDSVYRYSHSEDLLTIACCEIQPQA